MADLTTSRHGNRGGDTGVARMARGREPAAGGGDSEPRAADPAVHRSSPWWHPGSWRSRPAAQQPEWPDPAAVETVLEEVSSLPSLVRPAEVRGLQRSLAAVAAGDAFLLQAGDCAERFASCTERDVRNKLEIIHQLGVLLSYGSGLPVVKVGRIAGQFGKPRSKPTESVDGQELPAFRGEIVNGPEPTPHARRPDASRLRAAYDHSAATLNMVRALTRDGFAGLTEVHDWTRDFVRRSPGGRSFEQVADEITMALRFMWVNGVDLAGLRVKRQLDFYTSHEALLPGFEQALTRPDPDTGAWFATSAHMLWVGDRTRQLDGAHLEFLSGIANPVGVKVGPSMTPPELRELCERLDPARVPGRLVLISRMGAERVTELLPPLLSAVLETGHSPVWACDPMHGNTFVAESGYKTRRFSDITGEIAGFLDVHEEHGTHAGGLHLELTGEKEVTECLGGASGVLDAELGSHYDTACDPRLNADQAIELAFRMVADVRRRHHPWFWADLHDPYSKSQVQAPLAA